MLFQLRASARRTFSLALLLFAVTVVSNPIHRDPLDIGSNDTALTYAPEISLALSKRAPSFYARVLPLGASIVWGQGSSDQNGQVISFLFPYLHVVPIHSS